MTTNNVTRMLAAKGVAFGAHELPEEKLSAQEAAAHLGVNPGQMFKTIVVTRADGGKPILALVAADAQVNLKAVGRALGQAKVQAASLSQAEEISGLLSGGISPLALIGKGFATVLDSSAMQFEQIYLSGGQRGLNLSLSPRDLVRLTGAKIASISTAQ